MANGTGVVIQYPDYWCPPENYVDPVTHQWLGTWDNPASIGLCQNYVFPPDCLLYTSPSPRD